MSGFFDIFYTYYYALIHPFKTFDEISNNPSRSYLNIFESLSCSWFVVVFNALIRLVFISFVMQTYLTVSSEDAGTWASLVGKSGFSGHYIIIFSLIWDIFLFPIITLISVQLWIFLFRFFGTVMNVSGNVEQKSHDIVSVSMSSYGLYIIPFLGDLIQKLSQYILMFIGLKKEFNIRGLDAALILMTPFLLVLGVSMLFALLITFAFN